MSEILSHHYYILDGHEITTAPDVIAWAQWFETADRRVAGDEIGPYFVSTIFIGLDYSFGLSPVPLLFETTVFRDGEECLGWRYGTWEAAENGHARVMNGLRAGCTIEEIRQSA